MHEKSWLRQGFGEATVAKIADEHARLFIHFKRRKPFFTKIKMG